MAIRRASNSGLTGTKYNQAMAGNTPIVDVPDAPTPGTPSDVGTSRAYNNGAATIAFTAAATGGIPTSFNVTSSPGGFTGSGASPVTVAGLQSATSYTFTGTATNSTGTGIASVASSAVTATTVPQAPTIGTVTTSNSTTVSVPFTAGATGGKSITSYTITSSPSISLTYSGTTSPITVTGTFAQGTAYTFTIAATNANGTSAASSASNSVTPYQAPTVTGGTLSSDATYYYRKFTANGTLTVSNSTLTADVLVISGGGSGGSGGYGNSKGFVSYSAGAGGGAGGVLLYSSQSLSPASYSITVGGGASPSANDGTASQFGALTAALPGGHGNGNNRATGTYGSGGGGYEIWTNYTSWRAYLADQGTSPQGNAGGYVSGTDNTKGGGGGGAGAVGSAANNANGGAGGAGTSTYSSWGAATTSGQNVSGTYYFAGGGGGAGTSGAAGGNGGGGAGQGNDGGAGGSATANTGGGGGGGPSSSTANKYYAGGSGGSGIVIVRYTRAQVGG